MSRPRVDRKSAAVGLVGVLVIVVAWLGVARRAPSDSTRLTRAAALAAEGIITHRSRPLLAARQALRPGLQRSFFSTTETPGLLALLDGLLHARSSCVRPRTSPRARAVCALWRRDPQAASEALAALPAGKRRAALLAAVHRIAAALDAKAADRGCFNQPSKRDRP